MKDNMKEQARQIVLDMVQLLQGSPAKAGMSALDTVLGNLLMIRRELVAALPAETQAVYRMELLNILMVQVLSPYDKAEDTLHHMGIYILNHKDDTCECKAELTPASAPAELPSPLLRSCAETSRRGKPAEEDGAGEPEDAS